MHAGQACLLVNNPTALRPTSTAATPAGAASALPAARSRFNPLRKFDTREVVVLDNAAVAEGVCVCGSVGDARQSAVRRQIYLVCAGTKLIYN